MSMFLSDETTKIMKTKAMIVNLRQIYYISRQNHRKQEGMRMPRRGENIYKRKDGRWEGRYIKEHLNGKAKYGYVFAKTYKEVKNKLAAANAFYKTALEAEEAPKQPETESESFSILAKEWFQSQKTQWKQSSAVKYHNIMNSYLLPAFADRKISEITRDEIAAFSDRLLVSGGAKKEGLSPKTVADIISVAKNIFTYAARTKEYRVVDINGISIKQAQKPMRILSLAEQQKLSRYLCENLTPCNLGILLCLYTGLRIGEICALKWEDISFDEQSIYVHQTMQRLQTNENGKAKIAVITSAPKSDCSIRRVPVPDAVFPLLQEAKKENEAYLLTGMVHAYVEPRTVQNRFRSIIKQCDIEYANFHALRHTFDTRCIELGFDTKSLSEILGHASVNITLNRYVHPSMEQKRKNMNLLSELFAVK